MSSIARMNPRVSQIDPPVFSQFRGYRFYGEEFQNSAETRPRRRKVRYPMGKTRKVLGVLVTLYRTAEGPIRPLIPQHLSSHDISLGNER